MRRISVLGIVAALLVIGATADNAHTLKTPSQTEIFNKALEMIGKAMPMIHHASNEAAAFNERGFAAQAATTAATCDQEGYSAAQVVVLQACPSLSGLISGTVSLVDFLPSFCSSNCYTVIAANLPKFGVCLDSTTKSLVTFVNGCATRPECYGETALKTGLSLTATCGAGSNALTNFNNFTAAAKSDITSFCSGSCLASQISYITNYPRCVTSDGSTANVAGLTSAMRFLCTKTGGTTGDYCAWNLRSLGRLNCASNCRTSSYCSSSCSMSVTTSDLGDICTSCLTGFASMAASFGADPVSVTSLSQLLCSQATNSSSYCYIVGASALATFSGSTPSSSSLDTVCSGTTGECVNKYLTLSAAAARATAKSTYTSCAATWTSESYIYSYCQTVYEATLRAAAQLDANANLMCATNTAGTYCYLPLVSLKYSTSPATCFALGSAGSCGSGCSDTLAAVTTAAGCCLGPINEYLRVSSTSYPASYLPAGTFTTTNYAGSTISYTFTPKYAQASLDRSNQPMNAFAACTNTSDFWALVENGCAAPSTAPTRSVKIRLAYDAVMRDPATWRRIKSSLRSDMALAAKVPPSKIKNDTISADSSTTITTSRRASSSGIVYKFAIDADTSAATTFDSAATAGLSTPNTGSAVSTCTGCTASGQDASSLASGSSSGGGGSGSPSGVAGLSAALAAIVSVILVIM